DVGKWSFIENVIDGSYMLPRKDVDDAQSALASNDFKTKYDAFTKQAICPPSGILGTTTVSDSRLGDRAPLAGGKVEGDPIGQKQTAAATLHRGPSTRSPAGRDLETRGALPFEVGTPAELKTRAERAGWVPIYWLPWLSANIVDMTVDTAKDRAELARPPDN